MSTKKKTARKAAQPRVRRPGDLSYDGLLLARCEQFQSLRAVRIYGFYLNKTNACHLMKYLPKAIAWVEDDHA